MRDNEQTRANVDIGLDIYCPVCQYQLHQAPGDRCPECGYLLERIRATETSIPWVHRRRLGRLRAFWNTVWKVVFANRDFCSEYARTVDLAGARRFQCAVVFWAMVPVVAAIALTFIVSVWEVAYPMITEPIALIAGFPRVMSIVDWACTDVWPVAILLICTAAWLFAVTGCPSYFLHARSLDPRLQNNAIAMSYYACGPLAPASFFMVVALGIHEVVRSVGGPASPWQLWPEAYLPMAGVGFVFILVWWWTLIRIQKRTMPQLKLRVSAIVFALPLVWILVTLGLLVVLPFVALYVLVVLASLQGYP